MRIYLMWKLKSFIIDEKQETNTDEIGSVTRLFNEELIQILYNIFWLFLCICGQ